MTFDLLTQFVVHLLPLSTGGSDDEAEPTGTGSRNGNGNGRHRKKKPEPAPVEYDCEPRSESYRTADPKQCDKYVLVKLLPMQKKIMSLKRQASRAKMTSPRGKLTLPAWLTTKKYIKLRN